MYRGLSKQLLRPRGIKAEPAGGNGESKPRQPSTEAQIRSHLLLALGVAAPGAGVEVEVDEVLSRLPHDVDGRPRLRLEEALHLGPVVRCRRGRGRRGGQARRGGQGRGLGPPPPRRPEREATAQERHEVAAREGPGGPLLSSARVGAPIGARRARGTARVWGSSSCP
jgi:hypothetical protein